MPTENVCTCCQEMGLFWNKMDEVDPAMQCIIEHPTSNREARDRPGMSGDWLVGKRVWPARCTGAAGRLLCRRQAGSRKLCPSVDYTVNEPAPRRREWQREVVGSRGGGRYTRSEWYTRNRFRSGERLRSLIVWVGVTGGRIGGDLV